MAFLRGLSIGIGMAAVVLGLLWIGQGTGIVRWPETSFTVGAREWAIYGAILAAVGALFLHWGRRP